MNASLAFLLFATIPATLPSGEEALARVRWEVERDFYPLAIQDLRDALQAQPWNGRIAEALEIARSQIETPTDPQLAVMLRPESVWYPGWLMHPLVSIASYATFVLSGFALLRWGLTRNRHWLMIVAISSVPAAIYPIGEVVRRTRDVRDRITPCFVVHREVPLRTGNSPKYPMIAMLPKGVETRAIRASNDWVQVELSSGLIGWVEDYDAFHLQGKNFFSSHAP